MYKKGGIFHLIIENKVIGNRRKSICNSVYQRILFFAPPRLQSHLSQPLATTKDPQPASPSQQPTPQNAAQKPSSTAAAAAINSPIGFEKSQIIGPCLIEKSTKSLPLLKKGALPRWRKVDGAKTRVSNTWHTKIVSRRYSKRNEREGDLPGKGPFPM